MAAIRNVHNHTIELRGEAAPRRCRAEVLDGNGDLIGQSDWVEVAAGQNRPVRASVDAPAGEYRVQQRTVVPTGVGENEVTIALDGLSQPATHVLGRPDELYGPFTAEEDKQLRQFVKDVRRLAGMKFQSQVPTQAKVKWDAENGLTAEMTHPDDDDTAAAIARFRQIYNHREPTSFKQALDVLKANIHQRGGDLAADAIAALKDHETAAKVVLQQGVGIGIVLDDGAKQQTIDARKIIDAYFHGEYLHAGNEKSTLVEALDEIGPFARLTLYSTMGRLTDVYFKAANVVEQALTTADKKASPPSD